MNQKGPQRGRPVKAVEDHREVLRWYEQGMTYEQIADKHEVKYGRRPSASYLNDIRRRAGVSGRLVHDPTLMPWEVSREHRGALDARALRIEARLRAGEELEAGSYAFRIWRKWKQNLEASGMVVAYDPETGFSHVPPRPGLDNDLIRVPDRFTTRTSYEV